MKTSIPDFDRLISLIPEIIREEIIRDLSFLGEQSIAKVRDRSGSESWFDQSGNLRSSVGYAIYEKGKKVIGSTFKQILNGAEGTSEGRKMIDELAKQYSNAYALVVVAAMNYAEYVEALDNKDVLASTELWARGVIDGCLQTAKDRAIRRINALKT